VAGIAVSRDGAAGTRALFGDIATLPYVAASSGSLGAMTFIYLTQQPLFAAGQWLGVEASLMAGVVGVGILVADSSLPTAAVFAGLNAFPVVRWVRRTLTARSDAGGGVDWDPPGLLIGLGPRSDRCRSARPWRLGWGSCRVTRSAGVRQQLWREYHGPC